jgi:hypothetical protein
LRSPPQNCSSPCDHAFSFLLPEAHLYLSYSSFTSSCPPHFPPYFITYPLHSFFYMPPFFLTFAGPASTVYQVLHSTFYGSPLRMTRPRTLLFWKGRHTLSSRLFPSSAWRARCAYNGVYRLGLDVVPPLTDVVVASRVGVSSASVEALRLGPVAIPLSPYTLFFNCQCTMPLFLLLLVLSSSIYTSHLYALTGHAVRSSSLIPP